MALAASALVDGPFETLGAARASIAQIPGPFESFPVTFAGTEEDISPEGVIEHGLGGIVQGADGSMWMIEYGASQPGVAGFLRMDLDGTVTGEYTIPTGKLADEPEHSEPTALARGPDGAIWFTDNGVSSGGENLVGKITPTGRITEYPVPNPATGNEPVWPEDIAEGPEGDMWFTESAAQAIGRINSSGQLQSDIPIPPGAVPPELSLSPTASVPTGIARGPDGTIWFTNPGFGLFPPTFIGHVTRAGEVEQFALLPRREPGAVSWPSRPYEIALGPDGNLWFASFTPPEVESFLGRVEASGAIKLFPMPQGLGGPLILAGEPVAGPDGSLWFAAGIPGLVGRMTTSGSLTLFSLPTGERSSLGAIAVDVAGDLWLREAPTQPYGSERLTHVWKIAAPAPPAETTPPTISGAAIAAGTLTASSGVWARSPSELAYQWQLCAADGGGCVDLGGDVGQSYVVENGDAGHTLRVLVTARNAWGASTAASPTTAVIAGPAPRGGEASGNSPSAPSAALLGATLTWHFHKLGRYTTVKTLLVGGLTQGAIVQVACRGRGCPFSHRRRGIETRRRTAGTRAAPAGHACTGAACRRLGPGALNLASWFKRRRLAPGTRIEVDVTLSGWVGRSFAFTTRAVGLPRVDVGCLAPGSPSRRQAC